MTWVAVGVALAGVAIQTVNTNRTAKRRDRQLAKEIDQTTAKGREAAKRTDQLVDKFDTAEPRTQAANLKLQYLQQLQAAAPGTNNALAANGDVSDRYASEAQAATAGLAENADITAGLAGRIDAARRQREDEGVEVNRANNDIGLIAQRMRNDSFSNNLALGQIQDNPYLAALAAGMQGYGAGAAGGTGKATAAGKQTKFTSGAGGNTVWGGGQNLDSSWRLS